jgi:tetratricopeptide (TPR) repeat protein
MAAAVILTMLASLAGAQEQEETAVARQALAMCRATDRLPDAERAAQLDAGLDLALAAIAARPDDPVAHFAAFCNRAKRVERAGVGFGTLGEVRAVRRHIERALELDPEWSDALAAKGAFLVRLPRILGGDRAEGERLLRRALVLDPSNDEVRGLLGEAAGSEPAAVATLDLRE